MTAIPERDPGATGVPDGPEAVPCPLVHVLAVHVALREWEAIVSSRRRSTDLPVSDTNPEDRSCNIA